MFRKARHGRHPEVALLAEGVDRNTLPVEKWPRKEVALLAEGVDRNASDFERTFTVIGRPPRGGRG